VALIGDLVHTSGPGTVSGAQPTQCWRSRLVAVSAGIPSCAALIIPPGSRIRTSALSISTVSTAGSAQKLAADVRRNRPQSPFTV
jgi:hypothetical protein